MASFRLYAGIVVTTALLVTIAALAGQDRPGSSREPLPPKLKIDLIAFIDAERRIQTIKPDGTEPRVLTPIPTQDPQLFAWPTWSPDGRSMVFSKVAAAQNGAEASLEWLDLGTGATSTAHSGQVERIAVGVFHYALWSPDGERLAFVASEDRNLRLFLDVVQDDSSPRAVLDDGPLWMSWSADSRHLLVHRADTHFLIEALETGAEVRPLGVQSRRYRVPAWRPGTSETTILGENERGGFSVYGAEVTQDGVGERESLADVEDDATFLWSPDGSRLAVGGPSTVIIYRGLSIGVHSGLTIYRPDSGGEPLELDDVLIAYFWSPDSSRIAYVSRSDTAGVLRWMMMDTSDGDRWPLVDFVPTIDQLTMFRFFDQYAYSHSLWSPDSRSMVFAGTIDDQAVLASSRSAQQAAQPHVHVMDTDPSPPVSSIAEGTLAVWSPR